MRTRTAVSVALAPVVALAAFALSAAEPGYTTLISHRGESHDAPENTLPAYRTAVERGFGFECDVYLSKDGRVFTFHDSTLKRTTAGANTKACGEVPWAEIEKLDVGSWGKWKGSKFAGTRPALLEEAMPEYRVYWISVAMRRSGGKERPATAEEVVETLKATGADGLDIQFVREAVTADFVRKVNAAGFSVHVWTVDDLSDAVEAFKRGVATVTTNRAKQLLDLYRNPPRR